MTIARVQGPCQGIAAIYANSLTVTMSQTPTAGNLLIMAVGNYATSMYVNSISETGVTWTRQTSGVNNAFDIEIWAGVVGSGASTSITVNFAGYQGNVANATADVCEYSGLSLSNFLDKTAVVSGSTSPTSTGITPTTTQANELCIGAVLVYNYPQSLPTNGFTLLDGAQNNTLSIAYLENTVSATGTYGSGTSYSGGGTWWIGCIATFKGVATYSITASADSNSSISPSGTVLVNSGTNRTFSISANTNCYVTHVYVDGVDQGAISSYMFSNVTANHTITVAAAINSYSITASADANSNIAPPGTTYVNYDASQSYTMSANSGYQISHVYIDSIDQGNIPIYTFNNVHTNHTISVYSTAVGGPQFISSIASGAPFTVTSGALSLNTSSPLQIASSMLTLPQSSTSTNGYLSSTDWNTFNNKQNSLSQASSTTDGYLSHLDWNTFNNKQNVLSQANATTNGYLTSTDWNTFNNKQNVLSQANATTNGYLSAIDWNTFNNKQNSLTRGNLNGTINRISVSGGTGAIIGSGVTLSLPQDIHTGASPTFTGLTINGNTSVVNLNVATGLTLNGSTGDSGQVLTSNGPGFRPSWQEPSEEGGDGITTLFVTKTNLYDTWLGSKIGTDTYYLYVVDAEGKIHWGQGTNNYDLILQRSNFSEISPSDPQYRSVYWPHPLLTLYRGNGETAGDLQLGTIRLKDSGTIIKWYPDYHTELDTKPGFTPTGHRTHLYCTTVNPNDRRTGTLDPKLATDYALFVEKDFNTFGFVGTTSDPEKGMGGGAIIMGQGFTGKYCPPMFDLTGTMTVASDADAQRVYSNHGPSLPSSGSDRDIFYNTSDKTIYQYGVLPGIGWRPISTAGNIGSYPSGPTLPSGEPEKWFYKTDTKDLWQYTDTNPDPNVHTYEWKLRFSHVQSASYDTLFLMRADYERFGDPNYLGNPIVSANLHLGSLTAVSAIYADNFKHLDGTNWNLGSPTIQKGSGTTDVNGEATITFSTTFSTTPSVFLQGIDSGAKGIVLDVVSKSTTQFIVKARKVTGISVGGGDHSHPFGASFTTSSDSAGTPSGSISSNSAGTPSGSISNQSAGTPSGSISNESNHTHEYSFDDNTSSSNAGSVTIDNSVSHNHWVTGSTSVKNTYYWEGSPNHRHTYEDYYAYSPTADNGVHSHSAACSDSHQHTVSHSGTTNPGSSHTHTFTGSQLTQHTHTFTGSQMTNHVHAFTGTGLANHSHTGSTSGNTTSTNHAHTVTAPVLAISFDWLAI